MFPDSEIAQKFQLAKTKCAYSWVPNRCKKFSMPLWLWNFKEFSNPSFIPIFPSAYLLSFDKFFKNLFNPPRPLAPILLGTQEYLVNYGMAPFVKDQLVKNIVVSLFYTVSFDNQQIEYFKMSKWMSRFVIGTSAPPWHQLVTLTRNFF